MSKKNPSEDFEAGGLKRPGAKPEPLVGEDRKTKAPVSRLKRIVREKTEDQAVEDNAVNEAVHANKAQDVVVTEGHGADAVAELALEHAVEAEKGAPKDERTSAEAVDQGSHVRPIDIERAELDAGTHAELLKQVEEDTSPDAVGAGIRAAGDREGDHVSNVRKVAEAAFDENGPKHSGLVIEDRDRVESPHGRTAELHDPWQAARWAPHGDGNVPAIAYGVDGVLGLESPTTRDQVRGLRGDSDADVKRAKKEAGPGTSIARERFEENEAARRIGSEETGTLESFVTSEK